ncbi:response regulator transcription factor [Aestuariivita sp.]|jgi:DNA-binding response OmpR family regulator|uniref:response regulator transcription factor n=1 Tax=Aestuariivita sp. TaxID=1872407 RepID=UPI002171B5E7|nr:response regulator transcription factor [Aestuariivita sp.]MCE8008448.1 response regulator transcription factor [Aestuariivita sp.]
MNILLIEDELRVADFVRRGLKAEGWVVEHADDGETGLEIMQDRGFDVVILDLMLPGLSGQHVCQKMRARSNPTPVLMLTALDSTDERVAGLRLGADDYLPKPFDFDELIARVQALHRRSTGYACCQSDGKLRHQGLIYDSAAMVLTVDGRIVELSAKERELIALLMASENKALSRERILNSVWGTHEDPMTNVVDVYIGRLRKKLGPYGKRITTVRGAGYRFG